MKYVLVCLIALASMSTAFANPHVCKFTTPTGVKYTFTFKLNEGPSKDKVLVTVKRNGALQISHLTSMRSHRDSSADSGGFYLSDSKNPGYKYSLSFYTTWISSASVKIPGLDEHLTDCRTLNIDPRLM